MKSPAERGLTASVQQRPPHWDVSNGARAAVRVQHWVRPQQCKWLAKFTSAAPLAPPCELPYRIYNANHQARSQIRSRPHFAHLSLPDQLRLTALEAEDRLPLPMLDAIPRAADLLEEIGWGGSVTKPKLTWPVASPAGPG